MTQSGDDDKSREELLEELEALRRKNARLGAEKSVHLYRGAPIGLCYLDTDLRYVQINDWLAAINGLPAGEHLGRTIFEILPDAAARLERQFRHVIETGEPVLRGRVRAETRPIPASKESTSITMYPTDPAPGSSPESVCVVEDVTDRVETDEKLKRSEALYRTLVEAAPPIIWHADANGDLNYLNKAWVEMTGIAADDALGSKWSQVVHPDDKPGLLAKWEDTRRQGKSMTVECRFRAKDSTYRTIDFVAAPVHSPSGEVIRWVGINTDITDRQQAAEHLARANRRLAMTAEIGKLATSSLELSAVLDAILGGTMTALGAAAGVIFLIKPDTGKLTVAATDGVNSNMEHRLTESLGSDGRGGLTSRVARTGEAIYFRLDAGSDSRAIDKRMNSFIGVPISADDKLLAVMSLSTRAGAVFEPWDFELAKSVAAQVGMVVRNANLVGENFSLAAAIDQSSEVITITDIDGIMRYVNPAFEFITDIRGMKP